MYIDWPEDIIKYLYDNYNKISTEHCAYFYISFLNINNIHGILTFKKNYFLYPFYQSF